jgi:hypothetical protein
MKPKQDYLWFEFSSLFSRYLSGKMTKVEFELAWKGSLKKAGVTQKEFAAKHGGTR